MELGNVMEGQKTKSKYMEFSRFLAQKNCTKEVDQILTKWSLLGRPHKCLNGKFMKINNELEYECKTIGPSV